MWVAAIVIVVVVGLYFAIDRRRYTGRGSGNARPTGEVFRDPGTGRLMRVWVDAANGKREYREEAEP
ncbi:MAG: hypothetical protein ACRD2E_11000 [Terriglobales bacterium]